MLKSISLVILSFSLFATASAVANPLALFVEQCLQYQPKLTPLSQNASLSPAHQAVEFEKNTLALNNINDRIQYYRPFATDSLSKQGLLWCQLHLADELYMLTQATQTLALIDVLQTEPAPYKQLSERLLTVKQNQWDIEQKSKLHSAQASVNQALSQRQLQMQFNDEQCVLPQATPQTDTNNIDIHIAQYLIKQSNENCRKQAWFAYQTRAKHKIKSAISYIQQLQQQRALTLGYQNTAEYVLATHGLNADLLSQFLNDQTEQLDIAPWNIARALSQTAKPEAIEAVSAQAYLLQLLSKLAPLGLRVELLADKTTAEQQTNKQSADDAPTINIIRLWHKQRLLGELYTYPLAQDALSKRINAQLIKQSVIGHQFGQYSITYPKTLNSQKQQQKLIEALSQAIVSLAQGSQYYLLANKAQNRQQHAIANLWLSHFLRSTQHFAPMSTREQLTLQYQTQMHAFRAKVALSFYQFTGEIDDAEWLNLNARLSAEFANSFGQPWPQATDVIYSYQAIANQGISDYLPLWQQALMQLITQQGNDRLSNLAVFDLLVINEAYLPIHDQLEQLIGAPIDPHSLIWRFKHAGTLQE
ncbi:hypothetical protein [Shewanella algicola]|uniref:hypothetical protein n=1 Tax=Shewanella algicola TaxID=640633 RepID=UPI0024944F58|nr:hypothetical protein [Shewanella algicola]